MTQVVLEIEQKRHPYVILGIFQPPPTHGPRKQRGSGEAERSAHKNERKIWEE